MGCCFLRCILVRIAALRLAQIRIRNKPVSDSNLGRPVGEQRHTTTEEELASHAHGYSAYQYSAGSENGALQATGPIGVLWKGSASTSSAGSNLAHNTMQPSLYLYQMIKI